MFESKGLIGIIILVLDIYAIIQILDSNKSTGHKVAWIVAIVLLPFLGVLAWWFFARE